MTTHKTPATRARRHLADAVRDYLDEVRSRGRSTATVSQYRDVLENILVPWAEGQHITDPADLDDKAMFRLQDYLRAKTNGGGKRLSPITVRTYIRAVRLFLNWAGTARGKFIALKKPKTTLKGVMSDVEMDAMIAEAKKSSDRNALILEVLKETGVRAGELLSLTTSRLLSDSKDGPFYLDVSGKTGEHLVPVPGATWRRLKRWADDHSDQSLLFMGARRRRGKQEYGPLTISGLDQMVGVVAENAGVSRKADDPRGERRVYVHLFRHSFATNWMKAHKSEVALMHILGHTTLKQISETYGNLDMGDLYDAMIAPSNNGNGRTRR
jgi:integrase